MCAEKVKKCALAKLVYIVFPAFSVFARCFPLFVGSVAQKRLKTPMCSAQFYIGFVPWLHPLKVVAGIFELSSHLPRAQYFTFNVRMPHAFIVDFPFPRGRHFSGVWEDRDESDNFAQKHDVSLAKDKIRPSVVEEIRNQVCLCLRLRALHGLFCELLWPFFYPWGGKTASACLLPWASWMPPCSSYLTLVPWSK